MKRKLMSLLLALITTLTVSAQLTATAPNGSFTRADIQFWAGTGTKEIGLVVIFNNGAAPDALVWGYRYEGSVNLYDICAGIAAEDPRFYYMGGTGTFGGFGVDWNQNGLTLQQSDGTTLTATNGSFAVTGENYDGWSATDASDYWASGWGTAFWFLSEGAANTSFSDSRWVGATFTLIGGGGGTLTLANATYYAMPALTIDSGCPAPTNLVASGITTNAATVTWRNTFSAAASWYLYYKAASGTAYDSVLVTDTTYTFSGLSSNTEYNYYLRANCSDRLSGATMTGTFRTACGNITTLPFSENFDTYGTHSYGGAYPFPTCWAKTNDGVSHFPFISPSSKVSPPGSLYFSSGAHKNVIASLPRLDDAIALTDLKVSFKYQTYSVGQRIIVGVMTDNTDSLTFQAVDTIDVQNDDWNDVAVSFAGYTDTGRYIAIQEACNPITGMGNNGFVDDLVVDYLQACETPTLLAATQSATAANAVELSWNAIGNETSWTVYYMNLADSTAASEIATTNPHTVQNLDYETEYTFRVAAHCASGESDSSNIATFATPCQLAALPYRQDFEGIVNDGDLPACMDKAGTNVTTFTSRQSGGTGSGAWSSYAQSGNKFACFKTNAKGNLYTPMMHFSSDSVYTLSFAYKSDGKTGWRWLAGYLYSSTAIADSAMVIGSPINEFAAGDSLYHTYTGNFTPLVDGNYYLGIRCSANYSCNHLAIDDINVYVQSPDAVIMPTLGRAQATVVSTDSATLLATYSQGQNVTISDKGFQYKISDSTEWMLVSDADSPDDTIHLMLDALQASTAYDYRAFLLLSLDTGDTYLYSSTQHFSTPCATFAFPYTQGFEMLTANDELPACMAIDGTAGKVKTYASLPSGALHGRKAHAGNGFASFSYSCNNTLFTPSFEMTAGTNYQLQFYYATDGDEGWKKLEPKLFYTQNGADSVMRIGNGVYDVADTAYRLYSAIFTPAVSGTYYIGIYCKATSNPWYFCIDDISVQELADDTPVAPHFLAAVADSVTTTTAVLDATYDEGANVTITARGFAYKAANDVAFTFTAASQYADTTMHLALTGLQQNGTTYLYKGYIIYTADTLTDTVFSMPGSFSTACTSMPLPYNEGFETLLADDDLPGCMGVESGTNRVNTYVDIAGIGAGQLHGRHPRTGNGFATFKFRSRSTLYTPGFDLVAGTHYEFSFYYAADGSNGWEKLEPWLYASQGGSDSLMLIGNGVYNTTDTAYQRYSGIFTPASSGKYYIGIYCQSTNAPWYMNIDDIALNEYTGVIHHYVYDTTAVTICPGSDYDFYGTILTQDGIYSDTTATDSIRVLVLSHYPSTMNMGGAVADMNGLLAGANTYENVSASNGTLGANGDYHKDYVSGGLVFRGIGLYGGTMSISWGPSNLTSTTDAYSGYMISASQGGKDGAGDTYLTGYYSDYSNTTEHCTVVSQDGNAFQPAEVWVNNSQSAYNYMSHSWATGSGNWEKLNIVGYNANGDSVAGTSIFLGQNGTSTLNTWTAVDLSSFPAVSKVRFYLTSNDLSYGYLNVPSYFCIDDFTLAGGQMATDTAAICDGSSYAFGSHTLTTAGIYTDTVNNQWGCDSLATLALVVKANSADSMTGSFCEGATYEFGGATLTTGGIYTDTLVAANGCDSTLTLVLTMNHASQYAFTDTLRNGGYTYGGETYTLPGTYTVTLQNQWGCDSIVTLTLVEEPGVGMPDIDGLRFVLYPNPTTDFVHVDMDGGDGEVFVQLFDVTGRDLGISHRLSPNGQIDVSHIPAGTYLVKLTCSRASCIQRLIIK